MDFVFRSSKAYMLFFFDVYFFFFYHIFRCILYFESRMQFPIVQQLFFRDFCSFSQSAWTMNSRWFSQKYSQSDWVEEKSITRFKKLAFFFIKFSKTVTFAKFIICSFSFRS